MSKKGGIYKELLTIPSLTPLWRQGHCRPISQRGLRLSKVPDLPEVLQQTEVASGAGVELCCATVAWQRASW
jgi:hypothetical protein